MFCCTKTCDTVVTQLFQTDSLISLTHKTKKRKLRDIMFLNYFSKLRGFCCLFHLISSHPLNLADTLMLLSKTAFFVSVAAFHTSVISHPPNKLHKGFCLKQRGKKIIIIIKKERERENIWLPLGHFSKLLVFGGNKRETAH